MAKAKATTSKSKASKTDEQTFKEIQRAAILLKQASDPTRMLVLYMLAEGEKHVGALCDELHQSQPAVSHHLALLRHGGLITPRRQGKNNFYSLTETGVELSKVVGALMG